MKPQENHDKSLDHIVKLAIQALQEEVPKEQAKLEKIKAELRRKHALKLKEELSSNPTEQKDS